MLGREKHPTVPGELSPSRKLSVSVARAVKS
jgi:hypothetical protein